jgi:spermidine synthase
MTRAWTTLARVATPRGELALRRRGDGDFLIALAGRVIMTSAAHGSETLLGQAVCAGLPRRPRPRLLISGLGMGYTLRAALDALPRGARVEVAELEPAVIDWCRGPLAPGAGSPLDDPRVRVACEDVAAPLARAGSGAGPRYDGIALDLFQGPAGDDDPIFGTAGLARLRAALAEDGVLAVWSERRDARFEQRLRRAGLSGERLAPQQGELRHAVYVGRVADARRNSQGARHPAR